MSSIIYSIFGILIPFIGTSFGSSFVFFLKDKINKNINKLIIGFAAGVMIAASIWSLILPSVEMAENQNLIEWFPAFLGFVLGVIFLCLTRKLVEKIKLNKNSKKFNMLAFSVTLHNIPEGMAVGVCFAGFLNGNTGIELMEAMLLAIGIAIQNIPEGAIISMPSKMSGEGKLKAFTYGVLSRSS